MSPAKDPTMPTTARPVTGPDGDNPITDEQCASVCRAGLVDEILDYEVAIDIADVVFENGGFRPLTPADRKSARARCAAAWNARQGRDQ
jgi:hypothetical protein